MSHTLTPEGKVLTETQEGVTMPADYSFECVNDYVHSPDRQYEELECLALGMASHIEKITKQRDELAWALKNISETFPNSYGAYVADGVLKDVMDE